MSNAPENFDFLEKGWQLAYVLTGCRAGAEKALQESVAEVNSHPSGDTHRAHFLFFSALRRRSLRYPAVCELTGLPAKLHSTEEPARTALAASTLGALNEAELSMLLDTDAKGLAQLQARARQHLGAPVEDVEGWQASLHKDIVSSTTDEGARNAISHASEEIHAHRSGKKSARRNPATMAVGVAFLLLIGLLAWRFISQNVDFPEEALKIATEAGKASEDQFSPVETKTGGLADWFALKGFDHFQLPPGLEDMETAGIRFFQFEGEQIAQVAVVDGDRGLFFISFASDSLGISIRPEGSWRITQAGKYALAIRQEGTTCLMISFQGTKAEMETFLRSRKQG